MAIEDIPGGQPSDQAAGLREVAGRVAELATDLRTLAEGRALRPRHASGADQAGLAEMIYRDRRRREAWLGEDIFADPAWDILLDLFIAHERGASVAVTDACIASHCPASTALRWISILESRKLVERAVDQQDKRRSNVLLTEMGVDLMRSCLSGMQVGSGVKG